MSGVGVIREPRGIATKLITKNSTLRGWNFHCTSRVHAKMHVSLRSISGIIVSRLNFPSVQYDSISGSARKANREIVLARGDIVLSTCRILLRGRFRVSEAVQWNFPQTIISSIFFNFCQDFDTFSAIICRDSAQTLASIRQVFVYNITYRELLRNLLSRKKFFS